MIQDHDGLLAAYRNVASRHGLPPLGAERWRIRGGRIGQAQAVMLLADPAVSQGWALVQRDRPLALRLRTEGGAPTNGDRVMAAEALLEGGLSLHLVQHGAEEVTWRCIGPAGSTLPGGLAALPAHAEADADVVVGTVEHATEPSGRILHAVAWQIHAEPPAAPATDLEDEAENGGEDSSQPGTQAASAALRDAADKGKKKKKKEKKPSVPLPPQPDLLAGLAEPWASRFIGFR